MPHPAILRKRGPKKTDEPGPSKVAKEESVEQDVKNIAPILAKEEIADGNGGEVGGSANIQVMGPISKELLAPRNTYHCEYCSFTANTEDRRNAHRETKHRIFLCRFCHTKYPTKFDQSKHLNVCEKLLEMREKVKKQVAQIQDRTSQHIAIKCMHQQIKCPICKGMFESMFEMGDHRQHPCKSYAVRLFACSGCKTQFSTSNGLKSHLISRYNEKAYKCFDAGVLSFESMKIPKFKRTASHIYHRPENETASPVTLSLVPIKAEPTDKDELHDAKTQHALVAAHLLSDHDGNLKTEYYYAMRRMFYKVNCPYCGILCRTHAALHAHGLIHHPPHDRCLYQCGGCQITYQTPTGLGQHLKREFDNSNSRCYNTVNLVRKEDYLGPVTGWNKRLKPGWNKKTPGETTNGELLSNAVEVKAEPNVIYEEMIKKEEPDSSDYPTSFPSTSSNMNPSNGPHSSRNFPSDTLSSRLSSVMNTDPPFFSNEREVKEEPLDDYKADDLSLYC
ncbi:hypothetical protein PFISCL1PPCAC_27311 [Pristionchus fissidentatus]|uniref:C2H2-type domain-containing protein n=1 Tax=Pristionchus fissidentatus TaxID=1538716 RepID=A0AAV5WZB0_9BILA|nr:hypothetical protein PFISCL1PPCAC_27311 [Pristionchus fissidentatus]